MIKPGDKTPTEEEPTTYNVSAICTNCGFHQYITIEKGTLVVDVIKDIKCKDCGCTGTLEHK